MSKKYPVVTQVVFIVAVVLMLQFSNSSIAQTFVNEIKPVDQSVYVRSDGVTTDRSGNIYVTGSWDGEVGADVMIIGGTHNALLEHFGESTYVIKYNPSGFLLWAKSFGNYEGCNARDIAVDNAGNVIVIGTFSDTVDFNPGAGIYNLTCNEEGWADVFILKLDNSGNFVWAKKLDGNRNDSASALAVDYLGSIYVTGSFGGTVDFNPNAAEYKLSSVGEDDVFVLKLNSAGNFIWAKRVGGSLQDVGSDIAIDPSRNIWVTGSFKNDDNESVDFDPGLANYYLTSSGNSDAFVLKLDNNGNYKWAGKMGGIKGDNGVSIAMGGPSSDEVFVSGYFEGAGDYNPGANLMVLVAQGISDAFLVKLDNTGSLLWAKRWGSAGYDSAGPIAVDNMGNPIVTGYFSSAVDFDLSGVFYNLFSTGANDVYVAKYTSQDASFVWAKRIGGSVFEQCSGLATDDNNNVILVGSYRDEVDFNPGPGTYYLESIDDSTQAYTVKWNSNGLLN